jgi:hypothetical protein
MARTPAGHDIGVGQGLYYRLIREAGIFDFFKKSKAAARRDKIESLADSCQFELYKTAKTALQQKYNDEIAGKVAAGVANNIMQFGHRNAEHNRDKEIIELIELELKECHAYLGHKFQQNILGCLILLAALWQVPLDRFKSHIQKLHGFGLFMLGADTPDVSSDLPPSDLMYMYELTAIKG